MLSEAGSRPGTSTSAGSIVMRKESSLSGSVRRDTIRVGNRVQHPLSTGNGIPVRLCRRDDFPEDWPPTMMSYHLLVYHLFAHLSVYTWGMLNSPAPKDCSASMASKSIRLCWLSKGSSGMISFSVWVELLELSASTTILGGERFGVAVASSNTSQTPESVGDFDRIWTELCLSRLSPSVDLKGVRGGVWGCIVRTSTGPAMMR